MHFRNYFLALAFLPILGFAQESRDGFAIVIDSESHRRCPEAVRSYTDAVRQDGWDAFVCAENWRTPEQVRDSIRTWYEKRNLAGAVFVGDIPVAMIRGAQHLTSAFKMDEDAPMRESSVPSDRFYDDFGLRFEPAGRDSSRFFYYRLSPYGAQKIECDIFTGRITPSSRYRDKYEELDMYLRKAARVKREGRSNRLDRLVSYTGKGSFSDCMVAWKDEGVTLKEQIPDAFMDIDGAKFYTFYAYPDIRDTLLGQASRPDLDLFLFHHHGTPEGQWIQDEEGILLDDVHKAAPNVRFSIFDACYNGDFREDDYIANRYIMEGGDAIAACGNSVNVLQDKHSSRLLGLLTKGLTVGQWHQKTAILESHIIGDPTFRFAPSESPTVDMRSLELDGMNPDHLLEEYRSSDSYMNRLEAMEKIIRFDTPASHQLLREALDDPYEYIRRRAATYLSLRGDTADVRLIAKCYTDNLNSKRIAFNIENNSAFWPDSLFLESYRLEAGFIFPRPEESTEKQVFPGGVEGIGKALGLKTYFAGALNQRGSESRMRLSMLRGMRNMPYPEYADELIRIVRDGEEPLKVRVLAAEVLGWYGFAYNRAEISYSLKSSIGELPDELRDECIKTVKRLEPASVPGRNSFGIIVDSATFKACTAELYAYRDVLEKEGLRSVIVAGNWETPQQVKREILELDSLEGIVLVGEVPIAMIREGQHLTSAFKMNERVFPPEESSVPSDRFYDTWSLEFEPIGPDSTCAGRYFYRLSENGAQMLRPDIYSARMKVPGAMLLGHEPEYRYELMRRYLRKVVKAHEEENHLDSMSYFMGSAYNSDDMNVWRSKAESYKEHFPEAFRRASGNRYLTFREEGQMKWKLFSELQRPGSISSSFPNTGTIISSI